MFHFQNWCFRSLVCMSWYFSWLQVHVLCFSWIWYSRWLLCGSKVIMVWGLRGFGFTTSIFRNSFLWLVHQHLWSRYRVSSNVIWALVCCLVSWLHLLDDLWFFKVWVLRDQQLVEIEACVLAYLQTYFVHYLSQRRSVNMSFGNRLRRLRYRFSLIFYDCFIMLIRSNVFRWRQLFQTIFKFHFWCFSSEHRIHTCNLSSGPWTKWT